MVGKTAFVVFLALVAALLPLAVESACSIYEPGKPLVNGVPKCACGQAYVTVGCVGPIPSVCSNCGSWTTSGCKSTSNSRFSDPSLNIRCQCSGGGCCINSGSKSGMYRDRGYVCNAASGPCQNDAKCSGTSASCPSKTYKSSSTVCSSASGPCQNSAKCTGSSASCPSKTYKSSSTICSTASGVCENDAKCTGSTASCPSKTKKSSSTKCFSKTGPCQNDMYCTGSSVSCPSPTFVPSGTICSSASGSCENPAKCSGSAATCPTKTLKSAGTRCHTARGPCESNLFCSGSTTQCPSYNYYPNTTICDPSTDSCFTDANCPGNSPYCRVNVAKPYGTVCGNNSVCSQFTNNTCNEIGDCITAECTQCPDGFQGADCTCPGGPPTLANPGAPSLNATCHNGTWTVTGNINGSFTVEPGTTVHLIGNLIIPAGETLKVGVGSFLNISGCANISGTLTGLYNPKFGDPALVEFSPLCSAVIPLHSAESVELINTDSCSEVETSPDSTQPGLLTLLFTVTSKCDKKKLDYLKYIVAPVLSVAGAAGIALATILAVQHYNKPENPLRAQA